jgi:type IV fimbrial biogenesis protein FimT
MEGRRAPVGFSLIEMLVALAIVAIALAWGIPSLQNSALDVRRAAAVNAFMHTLYSARSESLLHVQFVSVCPSLDLQQCSTNRADWSGGWISFINKDHDQPAHVDPGEAVLVRHAAVAGVRILANRDALVFRHDSFTGTTASFFFCDVRGGASARAVIVSQTGRPRLSESDAYGNPLKCDQAR